LPNISTLSVIVVKEDLNIRQLFIW